MHYATLILRSNSQEQKVGVPFRSVLTSSEIETSLSEVFPIRPFLRRNILVSPRNLQNRLKRFISN